MNVTVDPLVHPVVTRHGRRDISAFIVQSARDSSNRDCKNRQNSEKNFHSVTPWIHLCIQSSRDMAGETSRLSSYNRLGIAATETAKTDRTARRIFIVGPWIHLCI